MDAQLTVFDPSGPCMRSEMLHGLIHGRVSQNALVASLSQIASQMTLSSFLERHIQSNLTVMPQVQLKRKRSARPSIRSSTSGMAQNAHVLPLPPILSQVAPAPFLEQAISSKPLNMPQVQIKRARSAKPSVRSCTLYKAQNAFAAPLPPIVSQVEPTFLEEPVSSVPHVRVKAHPRPRPLPPPPLIHQWYRLLLSLHLLGCLHLFT